MEEIHIGDRATCFYEVSQNDTAALVGSGGLPVLASPMIVAWVEKLCYDMLTEYEKDDQTSVGIEFNLKHLAPSPIGEHISVNVEIIDSNKNKITLKFELHDSEHVLVATGTHTRAIVNTDSFMAKL